MKTNQRQRIVEYIKQFGFITSYQAYIDLGITQLATRIKELKDEGYEFKTEWESKKNRFEEPVQFKKYYITNLIEIENDNLEGIKKQISELQSKLDKLNEMESKTND